jgi:microcin C transport system ATP-binding protein
LRKTVGHIKAVDGVTLAVRRGETLGVVGESGSGKTTAARLIMREYQPDQGQLLFGGTPVGNGSLKAYRAAVQMVFQDPFASLNPAHTVRYHLDRPLRLHRRDLSAAQRRAAIDELLARVKLDPALVVPKFPHELSGGQRQRISIARAVVLEPSFIVLDEPTSALDMLLQAQMVDLLRDLQRKRDLTYMFISHDLRVVASLASHLIVMRHGKVVEEGPASELFKNPKTDYTRALFAAAFRLETANGVDDVNG